LINMIDNNISSQKRLLDFGMSMKKILRYFSLWKVQINIAREYLS